MAHGSDYNNTYFFYLGCYCYLSYYRNAFHNKIDFYVKQFTVTLDILFYPVEQKNIVNKNHQTLQDLTTVFYEKLFHFLLKNPYINFLNL